MGNCGLCGCVFACVAMIVLRFDIVFGFVGLGVAWRLHVVFV